MFKDQASSKLKIKCQLYQNFRNVIACFTSFSPSSQAIHSGSIYMQSCCILLKNSFEMKLKFFSSELY